MTTSPFADSVYARPGLTRLVRHYDRNPLTGESILTAVAEPSSAAVNAENHSKSRAAATGVSHPSTVRSVLTSHRDSYAEWADSTTINRQYTG